VAFIGARFQIYDEELNANPVSITDTHTNKLLKQPTMLALDVETGENLFKYIWPFVYGGLDSTPFDPAVRNGFIPPCAFADPSAVDVWNTESGSEGDDGYVDHIFAGDMCGNLWGIKLFGFEKIPAGDTGLSIEMWPTRIVDESNTSFKWSNYRTEMQPITFQPAMSITPKGLGSGQKLRVIVGTGKYDDTIPADYSDKSDPAIMSLYNLEYPINMNIPSAPSDYTNLYTIDGDMGEFHLYLTYNGIDYVNMFDSTAREEAFTYDDSAGSPPLYMPNCRWVQEDDSLTLETSGNALPDCCRRNPANSSDPTDRVCPKENGEPVKDWWRCVYDFTLPNRLPWGFINTDADGDGSYEQTAWSWFGGAPDTVPSGLPGERVLHRPLIANEYVFVTTYIPPSGICDTAGRSYLYIFNYMCKPLPEDFSLPPDSPFTMHMLWANEDGDANVPFGAVIDLGEGMASEAVLSGDHLIIQMTDGTILNPENPDPPKGVRIRSWKEVSSD
jgi:type IV pilus assembly protein PilY1